MAMREVKPTISSSAPEQPRRRNRFKEMFRNGGIDHRYTGDVEDDDLRRVSTIFSSKASVIVWARAVSTLPIRGKARNCVPHLNDGGL